MNKKMIITVLSAILLLSGVVYADSITEPMSDPFGYFNVYSLGDIGTSKKAYGSTFEGVGGAAGDVFFKSFSIDGIDSSTGYALHTGGSATLRGHYAKGLDIGGDLTIGKISINGDVMVGGDVFQSGGGSIAGNLYAAGTVDLNKKMTVRGQSQGGVSYSSILDFDAISSYFSLSSGIIGGWEATGEIVNEWGNLKFEGQNGINVIEINAEDLRNAWGFSINAPSDAMVYINVINSSGSMILDSTNWVYSGGVSSENVIMNMPNMESMSLSGANIVNILAPLADTVFESGVVTGSLIVGNLEGRGQVKLGHFNGGDSIFAFPSSGSPEPISTPEPSTLMLMLPGILLICWSFQKVGKRQRQ